ncbi:MAG: YbfB/YjiJ family MFS transporter [Burkholderiales bacterium]
MTQAAALRIAFAGMAALAVAMGIGRFAFTPLLPLMQDDAGLSVAAGGYLASANYLGYFLGSLLATRFNVRDDSAVLGSMLVIGVATIAMGFTASYPLWLALRLIAGIANAWIAIFAFSWCLDRLASLQKPLLNSLIFTGVGAGTLVVGALCVLLSGWSLRSQSLWIVLGALALAVTAAVWRTYRSGGDLPHVSVRPQGGATPWSREAALLVFCFGASGFGYIIPATFLPAMARNIISDPAIFGWAWPVFGAAAMLSTLGAAILLRGFDPRRVWMTCHFVMAFGVTVPVFWNGLGAIMLAALCVGGTFMVITMLSIQEARAVAGAHVVQLTAAMTAAFAFGQILGPVVASLLLDAGWGFSAGLLLAGALLALSCAMLWRGPPGVRA